MAQLYVGIDLGTTNSTVSVIQTEDRRLRNPIDHLRSIPILQYDKDFNLTRDKYTLPSYFYCKNDGTTKKGRILLLFKSLNAIVDYNWKSAKKFPLLYPVGWTFFSARYLVRVLLGKRKMNLGKTYEKSGKRRDLYSKIRAFEPEK